MCFISKACFSDPALLALFDRLPQQTGTCELTLADAVTVIDGSENRVFMPIRSLARYYLNEWEYNGHVGGDDSIGELLKKKGLPFNFNIIDEDAYYDYIDGIVFAEGYYQYESGISMYAGYYDSQQLPVLEAIRDVTTDTIRSINRQLHQRDLGGLLHTIKAIVDLSLPEVRRQVTDLALFRARIGIRDRKVVDDFDFTPEIIISLFAMGRSGHRRCKIPIRDV